MAPKETSDGQAGPLSMARAAEEAAYTLAVQAYLWGVPFIYDEIFHNIGGTRGQQPLRVFVKGVADLAAAVEAQKGFQLMPLSAYLRHGLAYAPPEESLYSVPPSPPVEAPEGLRFFEELGHWMKFWLPAATDRSDTLVGVFRQIGLSAARGFEWRTLEEPAKRGLARD